MTFQIALMILKFVCLGSIICIVSIKIRFKSIHYLQSLENLRILLPPLILRLYTGCCLDQNFSISSICFHKVNVSNYYEYNALRFQNFAVFLLRMRRNILKIVMFVIEKMKPLSFSLFLDAFPPRPKMLFGQLDVIT